MTYFRRSLSVLAVTSIGIAGIVTASPAQAATINLTDANCSGGVVNGAGFSAATGDVVTITSNLTGCETLKVSPRLVTSASDIVVAGTGVGSTTLVSGQYEVNATSFSSITITFTNTTSNLAGLQLGKTATFGVQRTQWAIVYTGSGGGGESVSGASDGPAPVVQEFGLPASGTCDAAASKDLNWAGVASGGWAVSWGQWMNGGKGGAVCTRTLVYSTTAQSWTVAS